MRALNTGPLPDLLRSGQNEGSAARQCFCGLLHALGGGAGLLDKMGCTPEVLLPLAEGAAALLLGSGRCTTSSAQSSLQLSVARIYLQRLMHPDIGLGHQATRLFPPQPTAGWLSAVADALLAPQIACAGKHTHTHAAFGLKLGPLSAASCMLWQMWLSLVRLCHYHPCNAMQTCPGFCWHPFVTSATCFWRLAAAGVGAAECGQWWQQTPACSSIW